MKSEDWSQAVDCFCTAVRVAPASVEYREHKHRSCRRKFDNSGGVSLFDRVKLVAGRSRAKAAAARLDWPSADRLAEDMLVIDPHDAEMYALIAESAVATDRPELAAYAWKSALKLNPQKITWLRSYGAVLRDLGNSDEARKCFEKILSIDPADRAADESIKSIDISQHLDRGRDQSFRRVVPAGTDQPTQDPKLTAFLALGDRHASNEEFDKALEAYRRAREIMPNDLSLRTKTEDAEISMLKQQTAAAQVAAAAEPDSAALKAAAEQASERLNIREFEILSQRVRRAPDDATFAWQMAECLRRSKKYEDAITMYQSAGRDASLHAEAKIGVGECAVRLKKSDLACENLDAALLLLDPVAKPNTFLLAHYWLGRTFELQRKYEQAFEHFQLIKSKNARFRDVKKRIKVLLTITWP